MQSTLLTMPDELLAKVLSESLTAKQLSAVFRVNKALGSFVKDNMQFSLIDVTSDNFKTFFTYANEQGQKSFFACGRNKLGELGLGHSNEVTVPTEIPTPALADGFALTDVQSADYSTLLIYERDREKKAFLLVVAIIMVS